MKYSFYLAYPKADTSPVMLAIREKTKRIAISLGISVPVSCWDKESQSVTMCEDWKYINEKITISRKAVEQVIAYAKLSSLSVEDAANLYRKNMGLEEKETKPKIESDFMTFYQSWATTSFGRHKANRQSLYHFRVFKKFIGKSEPSFEDINYNLYVRFLDYLEKEGYKTNMQGTFIRSVKAAMNEAYKRGYHTNLSYLQFVKYISNF